MTEQRHAPSLRDIALQVKESLEGDGFLALPIPKALLRAALSDRAAIGERDLLRRIANANVIFPSMCANNMEAYNLNDELKAYKNAAPQAESSDVAVVEPVQDAARLPAVAAPEEIREQIAWVAKDHGGQRVLFWKHPLDTAWVAENYPNAEPLFRCVQNDAATTGKTPKGVATVVGGAILLYADDRYLRPGEYNHGASIGGWYDSACYWRERAEKAELASQPCVERESQ